MPAYDHTLFDPPAPIARVTLRRIEGGRDCPEVPMLIDSGADVTLLPEKSVQQQQPLINGSSKVCRSSVTRLRGFLRSLFV